MNLKPDKKTVDPSEEVVLEDPEDRDPIDDTQVTPVEQATGPIPLVGEKIAMLGKLYRCVSIAYADEEETRSAPEIRVRYRLIGRQP